MAGMAAAKRRGDRLPPPPGPRRERLPPPPPLLAVYLDEIGGIAPRFPLVVDREKTCPLLLRVFTKVGCHHVMEDFSVRGNEPKNEFQIYTWKDATLHELTGLVKEVTPEARRRGSRLSFSFVYPDNRGRFVIRRVGETFAYGNGRQLDDNRSMGDLGFETGDYLDVAIV